MVFQLLSRDSRNWLLTTLFLMPFMEHSREKFHVTLMLILKNCMKLNLDLLDTGVTKIFT